MLVAMQSRATTDRNSCHLRNNRSPGSSGRKRHAREAQAESQSGLAVCRPCACTPWCCWPDAASAMPNRHTPLLTSANSGSNTVSVLELSTLKIVRTLSTGNNPSGVTASPTKDEVYVVNTDSGTVSVIDAAANQIAGNMNVGKTPYTISVTADGKTGWVANAGSNTVTALDLDAHSVIGHVAVGKQPGLARVSRDGKFVAVANRGDDSLDPDRRSHAAGSQHAACLQRAGFAGHSA